MCNKLVIYPVSYQDVGSAKHKIYLALSAYPQGRSNLKAGGTVLCRNVSVTYRITGNFMTLNMKDKFIIDSILFSMFLDITR